MHDPKDDDRPQDSAYAGAEQNNESTIPTGSASGPIDLAHSGQGSNLYPLEEDLRREGKAGHEDEDLSINSDGTNPGAEYLPPLNDFDED